MSDAFDTVASIAIPAVATAIGGPIAGAAASGLYTGIRSGDPVAGLAAAGGSYLGSSLGSSLGSGTIGTSLGLGGGALSMLPEGLLNANLGGSIGGFLGGSLGESLGQSLSGSGRISSTNMPAPAKIAAPAMRPILENPETTFRPARLPQITSGSIAESLGGLTPIQRSSALATEGYYGGGLGRDEQNYFLNMVNRRLVDDSGTIDPDLGDLLPIEQSYLAQLGLGNRPVNILQGIERLMRA